MYLFSCLSQKWKDGDEYYTDDDTAQSPGFLFHLFFFNSHFSTVIL